VYKNDRSMVSKIIDIFPNLKFVYLTIFFRMPMNTYGGYNKGVGI